MGAKKKNNNNKQKTITRSVVQGDVNYPIGKLENSNNFYRFAMIHRDSQELTKIFFQR